LFSGVFRCLPEALFAEHHLIPSGTCAGAVFYDRTARNASYYRKIGKASWKKVTSMISFVTGEREISLDLSD
jgi:hypothetical protein